MAEAPVDFLVGLVCVDVYQGAVDIEEYGAQIHYTLLSVVRAWASRRFDAQRRLASSFGRKQLIQE